MTRYSQITLFKEMVGWDIFPYLLVGIVIIASINKNNATSQGGVVLLGQRKYIFYLFIYF